MVREDPLILKVEVCKKRGGIRVTINYCHLGISKNTGTPKWMVKIMDNPIKMDDFGGVLHHPYFRVQHPPLATNHRITSTSALFPI